MRQEKSAGALIYYWDKEENKPYFLLLKNTLKTTYWEFPKGHIEKKENIEETAKREAEEETGLNNLELIPGFKRVLNWFFRFQNELIQKEAVYFLFKAKKEDKDKARKSEEHQEIAWLDYEQAKNKMKIKNNKEMLKSAYDFIIQKEKQNKLF